MDREGKLDSGKKKTEKYGFSVQQHSSKHEARFTSELYNTSIIWFKHKCTKVWKVHQRAVPSFVYIPCRKLKQPIL